MISEFKMKRILIFVLTAFFVFLMIFSSAESVYAAEEAESEIDEISQQVNDIMEDYNINFTIDDVEDLSLENLSDSLKESIISRVTAPFKLFGILILIIIFSAFIQNLSDTTLKSRNNDNIFRLVYTVSAITIISKPLLTSFENASDSLKNGGEFMLLFIPLFAGIALFSGGVTTIGAYNAITIAASQLLVQISQHIFMPILGITCAAAIINSIYSNDTIDSLIKSVHKIIIWIFTLLTTLLTGFLTLKASVSTVTDTFATKGAKFVISGFVPVIGSAVSDAYSTVKGSLAVVKCTTGMAGVIAIVILLLPPLAELFAYRVVIMMGNAVADIFSVKPLSRLLKSIGTGISIATSIMISFSLLFIISTAIVMKTSSGG